MTGDGGLIADQRIAVVGTHRSGTSLVGELLTADSGCRQLYEPFNAGSGLQSVDRWFVVADVPDSRWRPVIDQFLSAQDVSFRHSKRSPLGWFRGTRNLREFVAARLRRSHRLVIKDPFLALCGQYLIEQHDFRLIYTVRHPCDFYLSLRRMGWSETVPLDDLVADGWLDPAVRERARTPADCAALLWTLINKHALQTHRRFPHRAALWSHERFCENPLDEMGRVAGAIGITMSVDMRRAIVRATSGMVVTPQNDNLHEMVRKSSALPGVWHGKLSYEEERALRTQCEPLYTEMFGMQNRWEH